MSELIFEKIPTGRTHRVGGTWEAILDEQGEPETEYALCAIVDGHRVPLLTLPVGVVEHFVGRPDTAVEPSSSSSSSSESSSGGGGSGAEPAPAAASS